MAISHFSELAITSAVGTAQITSKATGVTQNGVAGTITLDDADLAAAAEVSFIVTNSFVLATDVITVNHLSAGTAGAYIVQANTILAGSFKITVANLTAGTLGEAILLRYAVMHTIASDLS